MIISFEIDWQAIERFIGYGDVDAPIIFIGMEEGGCGDIEQMSKRSLFQALEPLPISKIDHGIVKSWRPMCDFMLKLMGIDSNASSRRIYQNEFLAKSKSNVALAEIMPYPRVKMDRWPELYKKQYSDHKAYFEDQIPKRKVILSDFIRISPRSVIVCYGKQYWKLFESIIEDAIGEIEPIENINNQFRKFKTASGTTIIFCPHFSSRFFNLQDNVNQLFEIADGYAISQKLTDRMQQQKQEIIRRGLPHSARSPE